MNYGLVDILSLIGSVGLFLYGMKLMSEGLQKAAGDRLRNILAMMTNNRFLGAITGLLVTALIQSSSATTVMIVSFVNSGLLSLGQSIAVIMGANVGSTAMAWIVALFGFKVNVSAFSIPLIAFAIPMMYSKRNQWKNWGEFLLGFALLFMGLDFLSNSVPDLQSNPEIFSALQSYADGGFSSVLLFGLVGMLLTTVVQSSGVTFAIVLIMCSKGWITFELSASMILGSNIGTCITPLMASASGNIWAKRAAVSHLLFNVLGCVWALVLYYPFVNFISWLTTHFVGDPTALYDFVKSTDPAIMNTLTNKTLDMSIPANEALASTFADKQYAVSFGLSLYHTIFNVINISVMIWFTNLYVKLVTKIVPNHHKNIENDEARLKFLSTGLLSTAELSLLQAQKEIQVYGERTQKMFGLVRDLFHEKDEKEFTPKYSRIEKYENISDAVELEIANYLTKVADGRLSDESKHQLQMKLRMISEIESIADSCYNLAGTIQRLQTQHDKLSGELEANAELMFNLIDGSLSNMCVALHKEHISVSDVNNTQNIENEINNYRNQLRQQNEASLNNGDYSYQTSAVYMDIITECEHLADYVVNVVEAIAETKLQNYPTAKNK